MRKINLTLFAAGVMLVIGPNVFAADYVPGVIIVRFEDHLDLSYDIDGVRTQYDTINRLNTKYGAYEIKPLYDMPTKPINDPNGKWTWEDWQEAMKECRLDLDYVVRYGKEFDPSEVAVAYRKDANVIYADKCYKGKNYYAPNDPIYPDQWHWPKIKADQAWNYWPLSERDAVVAVLDTGVQCYESYVYSEPHEDLVGNFYFRPGQTEPWPGYNCLAPSLPPNDYSDEGHGTWVAGVFGARTDNALGVSGAGFNEIKILPVKDGSNGPEEPYVDYGIYWAVWHGADVINMSFGMDFYGEPPPWGLSQAVKFAYSMGVVMVAALGNNGQENRVVYPAWYKEVIGVNATNQLDQRWPGSNYGQETEFAAPGADVWTTKMYRDLQIPDDPKYSAPTGTSFAAPIVSGMAGLIQAWIYWETLHPSDRIPIVRGKLIEYSDDVNVEQYPGWDKYIGWGRVNLKKLADDLYGSGVASTRRNADDLNTAVLKATVNVAPNPARGKAVFVITLPAGTVLGEGAIDIYDLAGRKVGAQRWKYGGASVYRVGWECAAAPPGVYVYRVTGLPTPVAGKFVVAR